MNVGSELPRLRKVVPGSVLLSLLLVTFGHVKMPAKANAAVPPKPASTAAAPQNPGEAENYRRLAAAKRKAAQNVPAKRDCYLAWARYYDCLAARSETGDGRNCGAQPADC